MQNAQNQRVAKLIDDVIVERYLWLNLTTLLAVYDGNNNLVQRFEYADSRMPISMISNGTKYYLHYNHIGSLRAISDEASNIVKEIQYDSYGNIVYEEGDMNTLFGFAGGLYDRDTGLSRFGYRDYDSFVGKWTAKDPIGFEGGDTNLYGYVLGDPVNFIDPDGLKVYKCKGPVNNIPFIDHHWIKTDTVERGMFNLPDAKYPDIPFFAKVGVIDEDYRPNALCKEMPYANENKVNEQLKNFNPLGVWKPWNQCQIFAEDVLNKARPIDFLNNDNHTTGKIYENKNKWIRRDQI